MSKRSPKKKIAKRLVAYKHGRDYKPLPDEQLAAENLAELIIQDLKDS